MNTKKTAASSAATETKTAASETVKAAAKPAAEKKTAAKAAKPAAEKKPAAKTVKAAKSSAEKTTAAKTASAKTETKAAAPAKKTAAKSTAKSTAKTAAKPAAAKKPAKKSAPVVSAETICAKLEKKISKTKAAAIKEKIAVEVKVYGFTEGEEVQWLYIEVKDGKATASPHEYNDKDFKVDISVDKAIAFVDGKITLSALIASDEGVWAEGNIAKAVKLAVIF